MATYEVIDREHLGGKFTVGQTPHIDASVSVDISADVTIGNDVTISDDVFIFTHDHTPGDMRDVHASPLTIGHHAWIGARAIVTAACSSIGDRAVVGAGAVVTHDIPPGELWAGVPARFVRTL